jgi:hypothetical protein
MPGEAGYPRVLLNTEKNVDGRSKSGHDEKEKDSPFRAGRSAGGAGMMNRNESAPAINHARKKRGRGCGLFKVSFV